MKQTLEGAVDDVRASDRLAQSPACLIAPDRGPDRRLEQLLAEHGQLGAATKPILEVNPKHALIQALAKLVGSPDKQKIEDITWLIFDEARVMEGEKPANASRFRDPPDAGSARSRRAAGGVSGVESAVARVRRRDAARIGAAARWPARSPSGAFRPPSSTRACCSAPRLASITPHLCAIPMRRLARAPSFLRNFRRGASSASRFRESSAIGNSGARASNSAPRRLIPARTRRRWSKRFWSKWAPMCGRPWRLLDLGVGSGAILGALLRSLPEGVWRRRRHFARRLRHRAEQSGGERVCGARQHRLRGLGGAFEGRVRHHRLQPAVYQGRRSGRPGAGSRRLRSAARARRRRRRP